MATCVYYTDGWWNQEKEKQMTRLEKQRLVQLEKSIKLAMRTQPPGEQRRAK